MPFFYNFSVSAGLVHNLSKLLNNWCLSDNHKVKIQQIHEAQTQSFLSFLSTCQIHISTLTSFPADLFKTNNKKENPNRFILFSTKYSGK